MPFSDTGGGVTSRLEHLGKVGHLQGQMHRPIRHAQLRLGSDMAWNKVGEVESGWVFAGKNGGTRGRTNGAGRIAVGETHPLRGKPVNIWRLIKRAAKDPAIRPPEIIRQDQDDVGFAVRLRCISSMQRRQRRQQQGGEEVNFYNVLFPRGVLSLVCDAQADRLRRVDRSAFEVDLPDIFPGGFD